LAHCQRPQKDFVRENHIVPFGFVYLDADHAMEPVIEDAKTLAPHMVENAIMAIDDVESWSSLPDLSAVGLQRVDFKVDEGGQAWPSGHHVIFYRKVD
jgi:hypothetical protein